MEARTSLRGARPASAVMTFAVALMAAALLGGTGGYVVRGLSVPAATTTVVVPSVTVRESPPYSNPTLSPSPYQIFDRGSDGAPIWAGPH